MEITNNVASLSIQEEKERGDGGIIKRKTRINKKNPRDALCVGMERWGCVGMQNNPPTFILN